MLRSCQNPQTAKNGPNRRLRRATHRFLRRSRRTEIHRVNFSDLHFLPPFCRLFLWKKHRLFRDCSRRFSFILSYPDAASSSFFLPAIRQSPVTFPHPSGSFAAEYRYVHTRKDGRRFSNKRRPSLPPRLQSRQWRSICSFRNRGGFATAQENPDAESYFLFLFLRCRRIIFRQFADILSRQRQAQSHKSNSENA